MSIESKNHRPSPVVRTTSSDGSRADSRPVSSMKFETYEAEREHYLQEMRRVDAELTAVSPAALSAEQRRIRKEYGNNSERSFAAWMKRRAELHAKKERLVSKKVLIQDELSRLKPLVKAEKLRDARSNHQTNRPSHGQLEQFQPMRPNGTLCWDGVAAQILLELQAIRKLLEERN